ncbi:baculoviral IAP repeat-containing protein [Endozoicomonas sp. Mp262]|uniref:baculoviral IAP repeat-containing protein n=1 Tax=Endozoicomonas sp. Mp262 TaxID=2919499 RepID=UPI0021D9E652
MLVLSVSTNATIENHTYQLNEAAISFQKQQWPLKKPDDLSMISAGFYFTPGDNGHKDLVQCPVCKTAISHWDTEDDPIKKHMSSNELCGLAQAIDNKAFAPWDQNEFSYKRHPRLKPHVVVTDRHRPDGKIHYKFGHVEEHVDAFTVMVSFDDSVYPYASSRQWPRAQVKMAASFLRDLGFNDEHQFFQIGEELSCLLGGKRIKQYLIDSAFDLKQKQRPGYPHTINTSSLYIQLLTTQDLTGHTHTQAYKDQERVRQWGITGEDILYQDIPPSKAIDHILRGKVHDVMGQYDLNIIYETLDELSVFFTGLQPRHILSAANRRLEIIHRLPQYPKEPSLPITIELFFILAFDSEVNKTDTYKTTSGSFLSISRDTDYWLDKIISTRLRQPIIEEFTVKGQIDFLIQDQEHLSRKEYPHEYEQTSDALQYDENSASGYSVQPPEYCSHPVSHLLTPPAGPPPEQYCNDPQSILDKFPDDIRTNYAVINKMDVKSSEAELFLVQSRRSGQLYVLKNIKLKKPEHGSLLYKNLITICTAQKNREMAGFDFITNIRYAVYQEQQDKEHLYLLEC